MKIAVMGAGGVGGYLGAKLAAAGNDVAFIARGLHLDALRRTGLRIRGAEDLHLADIQATDRPADLGAVEAVLFCVKLYDTEAAAAAVAPLLGAGTVVLTFQNGVESTATVGALVGPDSMLGGAAYFPANIARPGEIAYRGKAAIGPHIAFGEPGGGDSPRARRLAAVMAAAGIEVDISADTRLMLWEKFLLVAGNSAATALTRQTVGAVLRDPDMRWLLQEAVAEAGRVGRRAGVALDGDVVRRVMALLDAGPADGKSSQLVDLENGRRLELEGLSGAVVRLGRKLGAPTPVHAAVYAALKPFRDGAPSG